MTRADAAQDDQAGDGDPGIDRATGEPARRISEDWAATILGLVLVLLTLIGVIGKGMVP